MNRRFIVGMTLCFSQFSFATIKLTESLSLHSNPIIIAVIDTGADIDHPEIRNNIWTNEGETGLDLVGNNKANNNIDDEGNGFVDDVHGWNFVDNSNRIEDSHGHGTHISAIIRKEFLRLNPTNSSRTLPEPVRLMILKYYDPNGKLQDNIDYSTRAIDYANKMHVNVINYSGGGYESSPSELKALQNSERLGILVIAAAGNGKSNTDFRRYFPASYGLSNIISVAATNDAGELVSFSNFGRTTVDIAAPGDEIRSALPGKHFGIMSGTSQATAFVTGAAAKILATQNKPLKPQETLEQLLKISTVNKSLRGKTKHQLALLNE